MSDFVQDRHTGASLHGAMSPGAERVLWEGRPNWTSVLRHVFRIRALAVYFLAILAWQVFDALNSGQPGHILMAKTAGFTGLALLCLAILSVMAWMIWRTTSYLITDRRVILKFGVALPATLDVPLNLVQHASVKVHSDGTGDIALALPPEQRIAPLLLWPHLKPWQINRPEPMMRGIENPEQVAEIFTQALSTTMTPPSAAQANGPQSTLASGKPLGTALL